MAFQPSVGMRALSGFLGNSQNSFLDSEHFSVAAFRKAVVLGAAAKATGSLSEAAAKIAVAANGAAVDEDIASTTIHRSSTSGSISSNGSYRSVGDSGDQTVEVSIKRMSIREPTSSPGIADAPLLSMATTAVAAAALSPAAAASAAVAVSAPANSICNGVVELLEGFFSVAIDPESHIPYDAKYQSAVKKNPKSRCYSDRDNSEKRPVISLSEQRKIIDEFSCIPGVSIKFADDQRSFQIIIGCGKTMPYNSRNKKIAICDCPNDLLLPSCGFKNSALDIVQLIVKHPYFFTITLREADDTSIYHILNEVTYQISEIKDRLMQVAVEKNSSQGKMTVLVIGYLLRTADRAGYNFRAIYSDNWQRTKK